MADTGRSRLRKFIEENCLQTDFDGTLSTGNQSSFYFDCKKVALDGEFLNLVADAFLIEIDQLPLTPEAIGGLTMGADFIVAGVIAKAHIIGHQTIKGSIVRKEPKKHGTKNRIENQLAPGTNIVVIDDVITSGGSIRQACEELTAGGYNIVGIIALIDRKAGGKEALQKDYGDVRAVFDKDDFVSVKSRDSANVANNASVAGG